MLTYSVAELSRLTVLNEGIAPMCPHDKFLPPSMGHGVRFAVAQGHSRDPRMDSLKSSCRTSYWLSIETRDL